MGIKSIKGGKQMKLKAIFSFAVTAMLVCSTPLTAFAATDAEEGFMDIDPTAAVSYNAISISGDKTGVEIVKTSASEVSFEFLNVDNSSQYTNTATVSNGVMNIKVVNNGARPSNISVVPDSYKNTVRVYVPDASYSKIDINANSILVRMPDFKATVNVTGGTQGGLYLSDTTISRGTYNINFDTSLVSITADTITSNITVNQKNGQVSLNFGKTPTNLYLNTTKSVGIVDLPTGWGTTYSVGNGTPKINITNNGATYVSVK